MLSSRLLVLGVFVSLVRVVECCVVGSVRSMLLLIYVIGAIVRLLLNIDVMGELDVVIMVVVDFSLGVFGLLCSVSGCDESWLLICVLLFLWLKIEWFLCVEWVLVEKYV